MLERGALTSCEGWWPHSRAGQHGLRALRQGHAGLPDREGKGSLRRRWMRLWGGCRLRGRHCSLLEEQVRAAACLGLPGRAVQAVVVEAMMKGCGEPGLRCWLVENGAPAGDAEDLEDEVEFAVERGRLCA